MTVDAVALDKVSQGIKGIRPGSSSRGRHLKHTRQIAEQQQLVKEVPDLSAAPSPPPARSAPVNIDPTTTREREFTIRFKCFKIQKDP